MPSWKLWHKAHHSFKASADGSWWWGLTDLCLLFLCCLPCLESVSMGRQYHTWRQWCTIKELSLLGDGYRNYHKGYDNTVEVYQSMFLVRNTRSVRLCCESVPDAILVTLYWILLIFIAEGAESQCGPCDDAQLMLSVRTYGFKQSNIQIPKKSTKARYRTRPAHAIVILHELGQTSPQWFFNWDIKCVGTQQDLQVFNVPRLKTMLLSSSRPQTQQLTAQIRPSDYITIK